jgi:hypothetical protein
MPAAHRPVILLEFNELSPTLMDQFIAQGKLPNFARLKAQSQVFVTEAEEIAPNLEPWIQWVTVQTGLSFKEHGVFDLGDGHKLPFPRVFEILNDAGYRQWICASMNAAFQKKLNGYFLPDPWSVGVEPYPKEEFHDFFDYVRRNVQEHSRDKMPVSKADHLKFLWFMLRKGLSLKTISSTIKQLRSEKGGKFRWKRATILDRMQWDVFAHYWKRDRPDFSTFFINSTAHFQHMYWRNMDPAPFQIQPTAEEQEEYQGAVEYGYVAMDGIIGDCLELAGPDTIVILASALSQQPCLTYENKSGKILHRTNEPDEFFAWAGIHTQYRYAPVMSEEFHMYFKEESDAADCHRLFQAMTVDGKQLMFSRQSGNEVYAGCAIFTATDSNAVVRNAAGEEKPFRRLFYQASGLKSGMHHPDGIYWIRDTAKKPRTQAERVSLRCVGPTILAHFGLPKPSYMSQDAVPGYQSQPDKVPARA